MARLIGGVLAGIVVAAAAIFAVAIAGHQFYPLREAGLRDGEAVAALIASLPFGALLFVAAAWLAGGFAGGLTAALVSGRVGTAWSVGGLVACVGVASVFLYPHPEWMQVSAVIAPAIGALIAGHIARSRLAARAAAPA
ncbi:MAG TPA: hypothetical protein VD887_10185 [Allosphingosinicella sp.]|nr:hypothetical protein [Allosphingosinicella sp.]